MMELSDYRRGLFQWDTGRSLIVTEKDITEVHFQLLPPPSGSTETTDVPVSAGIAKIPDELLQSGLPIRAYAWGDGYSHYDQTFCVTKREKPTGYASDPSDAITLESVQAKLQAEIDVKIQMPQGGDAGDVLKKTESGVEWGQAAGQSDWAENDETAPGYVKNRPFYEKNGIIVETQTFDFSSGYAQIGNGKFVDNAEYEVIFDGQKYTCTCDNQTLGDKQLENFPFVIISYDGIIGCAARGAGTHAVGLKGAVVYTLAIQYLPATAAQTMEIYFDVTYSQLAAAVSHFIAGGVLYLSGSLVLAIYGDIDSGLDIYTTEKVTTFRYENGVMSNYSIYALNMDPERGSANHAFFLRSSTAGSKKQFKVTIDDSGVIKATAIQDADGT